jgi:competence protein ComGC
MDSVINKKVRAFTTVELMISLLITSIVVSIMASLYLNISSSSRIIDNANEDYKEITQFYSALQVDINRSDKIEIDKEGVLNIVSRKGKISYLGASDSVIRRYFAGVDTLDVCLKGFSLIEGGKSLEVRTLVKEGREYRIVLNLPVEEPSLYINNNLYKSDRYVGLK